MGLISARLACTPQGRRSDHALAELTETLKMRDVRSAPFPP